MDAATEPTHDPALDDKLRVAYATAMKHSHDGGRVEIHIGSEVAEYMRSLANYPAPGQVAQTCWGFPVVILSEPARPDHISVHVVHFVA